MITALCVFGTRPEAIKMCPLVLELKRRAEFRCLVCVTAQHREMLDQVLHVFGVIPDYDLDIMRDGQSLTGVTARVLAGMEDVLEVARPDIVLVHGDTTTSFAGALAAFYQKVPVGHVEAGLRSFNRYSPYPEEMNRLLTGRVAELHFAPTDQNRRNLMNEGITKGVFVTGNTVIDAFAVTVREDHRFDDPALRRLDLSNRRLVLVTAHRRENLGEPLEAICRAIKKILCDVPDAVAVYPVHRNPLVQQTVERELAGVDRMMLTDPVSVTDLHNLLARSTLVLTDSGGLQEEAPHFGVPVLVLRTETERPEAVQAGTVNVVGVCEEDIRAEAVRLLTDRDAYAKMARAVNPYGDGHASERIAEGMVSWFDN